jgi:hypothetical protein
VGFNATGFSECVHPSGRKFSVIACLMSPVQMSPRAIEVNPFSAFSFENRKSDKIDAKLTRTNGHERHEPQSWSLSEHVHVHFAIV